MKHLFAIGFIALLLCNCADPGTNSNCTQLNQKLWAETTTTSILIGNSVCNGGSGILFSKVITDSRCPTGAMCIWEGEIRIELQIFSGADTVTTIELSSKQPSAEVTFAKAYVIAMKDIKPYPVTGETMDPNKYIVTLEVSLKD